MFETLGDIATAADQRGTPFGGMSVSQVLQSEPENPITSVSRVTTCPPGTGRTGQVNQSVVCEPTETIFANATKDRRTEPDYTNWVVLGAIAFVLIFVGGKGR
jgi:hypothetical protein